MKADLLLSAIRGGLLAAGICASVAANAAVIDFTTDETNDLRGTFVAQGRIDGLSLAPSVFSLLPGASGSLEVYRSYSTDPPSVGFGTVIDGLPLSDSPRFAADILATPQEFASFSGVYTNSGQDTVGGTPVFWLFSQFRDDGGSQPTSKFSGSFCFSTRQDGCAAVGVPEPGTVALLGLGLAGLASVRRRKR